MAGSDADKCGVCWTLVPTSTGTEEGSEKKDSLEQLWNYLYHKHVRETHLIGMGGDEGPVPVLSFSFTKGVQIDAGPASAEGELKLCDDCHKELEKLQKLCEELEGIKKTIDAQVKKIDERSQCPILALDGRKLKVSTSGSVVGKENIDQALAFLGGLCKEDSGIPVITAVTSIPPPVAEDIILEGSVVVKQEEPEETQNEEDSTAPGSLLPELDVKVEPEWEVPKSPEENNNRQEPNGTSPPAPNPEEDSIQFEVDANSDAEMDSDSIHDVGEESSLQISSSLSLPDLGRSPSGRKRYVRTRVDCQVCSKSVVKHHLTYHMRQHTGEKPYKCTFKYCRKRFTNNASLRYHQGIHTGEKAFPCDQCAEAFINAPRLRRHKIKEHQYQPAPRRRESTTD